MAFLTGSKGLARCHVGARFSRRLGDLRVVTFPWPGAAVRIDGDFQATELNEAMALGAAVRIDGDFQATELNEAMAVRSKTIGVSPVAAPEDQYFWAQVYGRSFVRAGNNATGAQIYASSTAGLVDDSGTTRINGLSLTGVASSAGALVACALTRPKSDRT